MFVFFRILQIAYVIRRLRIDQYLIKNKNFKALKWLNYALFWVRPQCQDLAIGTRFKIAFEQLGPIWIKLGQLLSIQNDFFSQEIIEELKQLQESVTPSTVKDIKRTLDEQLQVNVEDICPKIVLTPLASASIAQVYSATLDLQSFAQYAKQQADNNSLLFLPLNDFDPVSQRQEIVIKVIRPKIRNRVKKELKVIRKLFTYIATYVDKSNRLRGTEIVDELENNFKVELDLTCEANNGQTLRDQWIDSGILYIPKVFLASKDVIISERIYGTSINNYQLLQDNNVDCELLAKRGVEIFFRQLLEFNFFHADMHPGNIFANIEDPSNPTYIAIDYGLVGSLTSLDKKYLIGNLIAFFSRDYKKIAQLHIESGWIRGNVDIHQLERNIEISLDPLFNKALNEIQFSLVLKKLFKVAQDYNMVVQPQLIMLQKTLVYVEAMGRNVYPNLNLWETAKPILEQWFKQEYSVKNQARKVINKLPDFMDFMSYIPDDMYRVFDNHHAIIQKMQLLELQVINNNRQIKTLLLLILALISLLSAIVFFTLQLSGLALIFVVLTIISVLILLGSLIYWNFV